MAPFYGWGSTASRLEPLRGGSLLFTMTQLICKRKSIGYSLCSQTDFLLPRVKSINYGLKVLRYFGRKIWNILPNDIKNSRTL